MPNNFIENKKENFTQFFSEVHIFCTKTFMNEYNEFIEFLL